MSFKNPNVTFKDMRQGRIFWTYREKQLIKFRLLETFKYPDDPWEGKTWIGIEILVGYGVARPVGDTSLYKINPDKYKHAHLFFPSDSLVTFVGPAVYATPQAAIRNMLKDTSSW